MEFLQGGYHEPGKLQYRQHGSGKAKRKMGNNIYIYFFFLHCQCIFLYWRILKRLCFSVGIAKDGLPSVSWHFWMLPVVCSLLRIQNLLCRDSLWIPEVMETLLLMNESCVQTLSLAAQRCHSWCLPSSAIGNQMNPVGPAVTRHCH